MQSTISISDIDFIIQNHIFIGFLETIEVFPEVSRNFWRGPVGYTVKNIMKFTIYLLYIVVWKLKTGFSKRKFIYFKLEIK